MKFNEFRHSNAIRFRIRDGRYFIAKVECIPGIEKGIFAVINSEEDLTVIAKEGSMIRFLSRQGYYRIITFDLELPFGLSGFLSHVSSLLAKDEVPIFVLSSFSTDHILVREELLEKAVDVLRGDRMLPSGAPGNNK